MAGPGRRRRGWRQGDLHAARHDSDAADSLCAQRCDQPRGPTAAATLLYYTGMTRIAKNILEQVVGGYLDRNAAILAALEEEHLVAHAIADALSRKDAAAFGQHVNAAWELQKRLCGTVTNAEIERLLGQVRPFVHGMRISGAGSGGFLLMICKSPSDAAKVRALLEREPLNDRSRFFDFDVNETGLEVTTC